MFYNRFFNDIPIDAATDQESRIMNLGVFRTIIATLYNIRNKNFAIINTSQDMPFRSDILKNNHVIHFIFLC